MYFPLILFFVSLIGITVMIGKKLVLLRNQPVIITEEEFIIQLPDLKDLRHSLTQKTKKVSYIILVRIFRLSIRSSKFLKHKYNQSTDKIKHLIRKYVPKHKETQKEVSGFLKKVSEYKNRVKEIKDKVREEENENL